MNAPFNIAEQRKTAQAARDRYDAKCDKLARDLTELSEWAKYAAKVALADDYYGTAVERRLLNLVYDVTECEGIYDRLDEITEMQEAL